MNPFLRVAVCANLALAVLTFAAAPAVAAAAQQEPRAASPAATPINVVIGDDSFAATFGSRERAVTADEDLRIRTHLRYVEQLLRGRDVHELSPELQAERTRNLDRLHTYHENGVFPRNHDHPEARRPCFIDRDGRICAVGYLIEQSAGRALAEAINARFQYAFVAEMQDERLRDWARVSGLTEQELATIQPTYAWPASAGSFGASCAPVVALPATVVAAPQVHFGIGLFQWFAVSQWWLPTTTTAQWIGGAQNNDGLGTMTMRHTFDLTGFNPAMASLVGSWSAPPGATIWLNGVPTGQALPSQAGAWTAPQPFTISSGFVPGVNVLQFQVPEVPFGVHGLLVASLSGTAMQGSSMQTIPGLFPTGVDAQGTPLADEAADPHYRTSEPPLRAVGRPVEPNPGFALTVGSLPNRLALLALSDSGSNVPIGNGCEILVGSLLVTQLSTTDAAGTATFALPIPAPSPWLLNFNFVAQAVVEDPASPFAGLSLTQGLWLFTGY